ncbi:uncharacterized protein EI90DRAFT_3057023 [Cantharellus anzutake]|uniref:uncharacterized protein n=1 Tax=Cantharellus anzutake TaxID=1750568 RepID=UPI0019050178|nr:uncharacterized protein EI90DRAFT_3057023 [Cantharellus anzutake]KAF8331706.1 hypothetical protein EI90DRAFT_3057023 [Cantharellus anzutake]
MAQLQSSPSTSTITGSSLWTAVAGTPPLQFPPTYLSWDGDRGCVPVPIPVSAHLDFFRFMTIGGCYRLHIYMIDQCRKRDFRDSMQALYNEMRNPPEEATPPIDAPQGLF